MAAPVLAVGDGALGFWSAVREVFPETREQRCWWHKIGNVLNALPKSAQPGAKKALAEIWNAEDKDHAQAAANVFAADYGTKWPKAAAKITDDLDVLLAFYDYPAEHWIHLRATNPISVNRPWRSVTGGGSTGTTRGGWILVSAGGGRADDGAVGGSFPGRVAA
jgi:transposase-like protein